MTSRADELLAGPRGRRLCLALVQEAAGHHGWPTLRWRQGPSHRIGSFAVDEVRDQLATQVAATDLTAAGRPERVLDALLESVDQARYWQPPDDADHLLTHPEVAAVLAPVAAAVADGAASQWWTTPLDPDQHAVAFAHEGRSPTVPGTQGAQQALQRWREAVTAEEEQHRGYWSADPATAVSGSWWSVPLSAGLPVSSRSVSGVAAADGLDVRAPAGLVLVEDEMGWPSARSWPLRAPAGARVLEITGPDAWTALVARHPWDVTASRRGTWWQVTGWDGRWMIPDWASVAAEFDAVHLTVDGYLATATRALPVPGTDAATVLGGAAPDATWWLTDLPALGEPTTWRREDGDLPRWTPA